MTTIYIWVEGNDDERFFDKIIMPQFEKKYDLIKIIKYAEKPKKYINNFIKSIKSMKEDYLFITDINSSKCVTTKKEKIKEKYNIDENKIVVVVKEIESWYLAGLNDENLKKFKMKLFKSTDNIIKEQFNNLIPKKFDSRIDFMLEILKHFSVQTAKQKNKSFDYFQTFFIVFYCI